jgi:hypothetical protein
MSNPKNLTELAESLAESARAAHERGRVQLAAGYPEVASTEAGYGNALLDTRATVLAMIADINRRIVANNHVTPTYSEQFVLNGRIEAYEDVRGGGQ